MVDLDMGLGVALAHALPLLPAHAKKGGTSNGVGEPQLPAV
jgi:hypothetical protein